MWVHDGAVQLMPERVEMQGLKERLANLEDRKGRPGDEQTINQAGKITEVTRSRSELWN